MKKRIICALLTMFMVLSMMPATALTVSAAEAVSYIDRVWDGTQVVSTEKTVSTYTVVTAETTTMSSGWYVVKENVTVDDYITVSGTARIILCDGQTLTITKNLRVSEGNSVFIYGQQNDTGKLSANANSKGLGAGIGGYTDHANAGQITINGGVVEAKGRNSSAGIGGAIYGGAGQITINGGKVTATSAEEAAGIGTGHGGGDGQLGQTITVNGGIVSANGITGGAGIGFAPGHRMSSEQNPDQLFMTITINGGFVAANTSGRSQGYAPAIGAATGVMGNGTIHINGGTVFATADEESNGYKAVGIGSTSQYSDCNVLITGGTVLSKGIFDFGQEVLEGNKIVGVRMIPKNGNGQDLALRTVTIDDAADQTQLVSASGFSYGVRDVYTDGNKLYFYLPEDTDLTGTTLKTAAGCVYEWNGTAYTHTYMPADCLTPAKCSGCGKTVGEPLGHNFINGFCSRSGCDVNEPPVSDNGTYKIGNAGQLYWFAEHVSAGNVTANAVLTADITVNQGDLSAMTGPDQSLKAWMPIGKVSKNETKQYNGTFDGAGYTINGLYFYTDAFEASYGGLVGKVGRNGIVKNVTIAKSWFGATSYTGAIVGILEGGTIDNCHNESFVGAAARIGGIVGHISSGTVANCTNSGKVGFYKAHPDLPLTFECIGGIAGNNSGTIRMCTNYGQINGVGAVSVAGIAGQAQDGKIEYSLNMATINGETHTGGISGWTYNSTLTGCINIGTINGTAASASLTGGTNGAKFSNCYYVGDKATGYAETVNGAAKITVDQLYSGEIGYNLGWGQTLDGKSLPYPGGPTIYRYYTSTGAFAYTNDSGFTCYHKDGTATCMEPATCSGCKQAYGSKNPENHVGGDDSYYINPEDPTTHCKGCPCGEASVTEAHTWNRDEAMCTKCHARCGIDVEHPWHQNGGYCLGCRKFKPAEMDTDGFYKIANFGNLAWFAEQVNNGDTTINGKLTANISTTYHVTDNYAPIGRTFAFGSDAEGGFAGIFDGQGYYIYGFDYLIPVDSDGTYGVFGTIANGGIVRNLGMHGGYMNLGDGTYDVRAGLIAGQVSEGGLIENCYVINNATLRAPQRVAGGIAGLNMGTIRSCYTYGVEIEAYSNRFGGIVGDYQGGTVINCFTDHASVGSNASGVVGTLVNCEAGVTIDRFISGEITYKLNGGVTDGTQPYYQTLTGAQSSKPSLSKSAKTVYGWVNAYVAMYSNALSFNLDENLTFGAGEYVNLPAGATVVLAEGVIFEAHVDIADVVDGTFTGSGHAYFGKWSYENNGTPTHFRNCRVEGCEERQTIHTDHIDDAGTATCANPARCNLCDVLFTRTDGGHHDPAVAYSENGFCENGCYQRAEAIDGVYQITNAGNLFWFAQQVNAGSYGANAVLTANIDLEGRQWMPIGSVAAPYTGNFNGQNHTISGFAMNMTGGGTWGFFGSVSGSRIENFSISGEVIVNCAEEANYGVIGRAKNATISNIHSTVDLNVITGHGANKIGGVVGYAMLDSSSLTIDRCSFSGKMRMNNNDVDCLGGILAYVEATGVVSITNCGYYGEMHSDREGSDQIGGIMSYYRGSNLTLQNCLSVGIIVSSDSTMNGAIMGVLRQHSSADEKVRNNYYLNGEHFGNSASDDDVTDTYNGISPNACAKPTRIFNRGEVAYLLGEAWGQKLGTDKYPILGGAKVYPAASNCLGTGPAYSNTENEGRIHVPNEEITDCTQDIHCYFCNEYMMPGRDHHEFDENFKCIHCEVILPGFNGFLTLNETIDLHVIIPEGVELEGNVISVKFSDGTEAPYTLVSTEQGVAIRHSLFANQMTREITVQIFDSEGDPLTKPLTISVRGYVEKLLATTDKPVEKALVIRMLDYGALAQLYTGSNVTDLANSIIDANLRAWINAYEMGTPDAYTPATGNTGGVFSGNLTLSESIVMNIVTNTAHIGENGKLVVKLNGEELAAEKYELVTFADGTIRVSYGFHGDKMNQVLTVAIVDKDTGVTRIGIDMSVRKYAHMILDAYRDIDPTLCAMLVAMLDYGALAQVYGNTATDDLANRYVSTDQRTTLTGYPWPEN